MICDGSVIVNFGCLPPLPDGYTVKWHDHLGMYLGHGPGDWESAICWNRFWIRRWCFDHAATGHLDPEGTC